MVRCLPHGRGCHLPLHACTTLRSPPPPRDGPARCHCHTAAAAISHYTLALHYAHRHRHRRASSLPCALCHCHNRLGCRHTNCENIPPAASRAPCSPHAATHGYLWPTLRSASLPHAATRSLPSPHAAILSTRTATRPPRARLQP